MANALGISDDMKAALAEGIGENFLSVLDSSATFDQTLSHHIDERLSAFRSAGASLRLHRSRTGGMLDLGGANPSSSTVMCFLPAKGNAAALKIAARVLGKSVGADSSTLAFVTRRFISNPDPQNAEHLIVGYADAVLVCHVTPNGVDYVRIDAVGAHAPRRTAAVPRRRPAWLARADESLPERATQPPAAPGFITGLVSAHSYRRIPVQPVGRAVLDGKRSYTGIKGVVLQTVRWEEPNLNLVFKPARLSSTGNGGVLKQAIDDNGHGDVEIVISAPRPAGAPEPGRAPQQMGYGDSGWGCGGRSTPESCIGCCDSKEGTAVEFGMTVGGRREQLGS